MDSSSCTEIEDPLVEFAIDQEFPAVVIGKTVSPLISFVDNNEEQDLMQQNILFKKGKIYCIHRWSRPENYLYPETD